MKAGHGLDVPSFVGHLRRFWTYGLTPPGKLASPGPLDGRWKGSRTSWRGESGVTRVPAPSKAYMPPHQRRRPDGNLPWLLLIES